MSSTRDAGGAALAEHPLARELRRVVQRAVSQVLREAAQSDPDGAPALAVPPAEHATGPSRLAAAHPGSAQARREAQALYGRCLAYYRSQVQRPLRPGRADDDAGLAAAYFVLANLAATEGAEPDATHLPALERQLRHLIWLTQAWDTTPLAQRQGLFEQLALLGVLVNESRLQARTQGDAARANLQRAARAYLKQLLGLDADQIAITPQGLMAADTVH
jgi:hypothetical protein